MEAGVSMHPANWVKRYKYEEEMTLAYTMRRPNGEPFRTVVVLSEPIDKPSGQDIPEPEKEESETEEEDIEPEEEDVEPEGWQGGKVTPPSAVEWHVKADGTGVCKLEDGWWCNKPWRFYDPKYGDWFSVDPAEWNEPEGLDDKCPLINNPTPVERQPNVTETTVPQTPANGDDDHLATEEQVSPQKRSVIPAGGNGVTATVLKDELSELLESLGSG
ncbi:hypothetical protein CDD83_8803 [Cordyceps sp. RAO-2017]|nr:hypothetical protein CDD83_8803 [Cordyceps sp. RAO-2017]